MDFRPELYVALGFIARAVIGRKVGALGEKLLDAFTRKYIDPLVQNYIIRSERRMAIWLHHQRGHHPANPLHCEIGDCRKVTPKLPAVVHYEDEIPE